MLFLGEKGYRVIAHDRRGHGRSSQSWNGNEMDTYADDLAKLIETLDLKNATLVRPFLRERRPGMLRVTSPARQQAPVFEGCTDRLSGPPLMP